MSGRAATTDVIRGKYAIAVGIPDKPLPNGWNWHRLTDIAEMATGHTPSRSHAEYWDGPIAWIGIKDARVFHGRRIDTTFQTVTQAGIDNSASVLLPANTVCLSRTASVGYVTIMNRPMATSQDFVNWVCSPALLPDFLLYLLITERDSLLKFGKGTTHTTIYFPEAKALAVAVPPIAEQKRIVAKLEELFSDLDAGVAALERVRAKLKRYRASVLNAAVTGKLTEAWRQQNPPAEPADKLLARILGERRKQWEAEQLRKFAEAARTPPRGWKEKYTSATEPDHRADTRLPDGWCWATVKQVAAVQGGIQKQPSRAPRDNAYPYLRVANVLRDRLDLTDVQKLEVFAGELERLRLERDDILIVEGNGSRTEIGRSAIWSRVIENCIHQNHIIRVRYFGGPPKYLNIYWNSPTSTTRVMREAASTSGLYTLSVGKISSLPVPLPPAQEQLEIVSEVECRLSVIDAVEVEVEHGLKRAARLRQAILKRAFEGKLVAQEPGDAPVDLSIKTAPSTSGIRPRRSRTSRVPKLPRRKHRKGIVFDRGAVMARVVRRLGRSPYFGRTEAMKTLYVGEAWLGIDLELEPVREKRGPLDKAIYKIESLAQKQRWFATKKVGTMFRYTVGPNIQNRLDAAERIIGDKVAEFDRLLDEIEKLDTDRAELFATSFAVWNDLLLDQKIVDSQAIIAGVHGWHPSKIEKFPADRIERCIKWMNEKGFVPTGRGPRSEVLLGDGGGDDEES